MIRQSLLTLETYTKHATTILFVVGFFIDMALLPDISDRLTQYIGLIYLTMIGVLILFREWVVSRNTATNIEQKLYSLATFAIAYFSGSALSFVFVYALRGAALSVSWPLFIILLLCSLANELVSSHKYRFTLDIGIYFTAVLFYAVFNVPILIKEQNDIIFLISLVLSALFGFIYISLLSRVSEVAHYEAPRGYALAIGIPMFVGMLYILNVLPAVPLSLSASGVYHSITHYDDGSYLAKSERKGTTFPYLAVQVYHLSPNDNGVYVFASVKAPTELKAPILHVWEYYDEVTKNWGQSTVISYTTEGGRPSGYRAYSHKENITEGLWRVTIRAGNNRVVGRVAFKVKKVDTQPELINTVF